jgi:hypothetical protein
MEFFRCSAYLTGLEFFLRLLKLIVTTFPIASQMTVSLSEAHFLPTLDRVCSQIFYSVFSATLLKGLFAEIGQETLKDLNLKIMTDLIPQKTSRVLTKRSPENFSLSYALILILIFQSSCKLTSGFPHFSRLILQGAQLSVRK